MPHLTHLYMYPPPRMTRMQYAQIHKHVSSSSHDSHAATYEANIQKANEKRRENMGVLHVMRSLDALKKRREKLKGKK
jgi:hypothetical protein